MTIELHATPQEVMRAVDALREFGQQHGVGEKDLFALCLALEECGSNIVKYALKRDPSQTFEVRFEHTADSFVIELRDRGPAFDPTTVAERKPFADEDEPPGRWGIQLVRRHMDEIRYTRKPKQNILRLTKHFKSEGAKQSFPQR